MGRRVAGLLLFLLAAPLAAAEPATFRFAPADGTSYVLEAAIRQTRSLAGLGSQSSVTVSRTQITVARSATGFRLTSKPLSVKVVRDGQEVDDPLMGVLQEARLVYVVDADGKLVAVEGFAPVVERLNGRLSEEEARAMAPVLNEQALVARERVEWEGRYGDFIGKSFAEKDVWKGSAPLTLPDGKRAEYRLETSFGAPRACGEKSCVEVRTAYDENVELGGLRVSGAIRRVIEPDTMQIHSEHASHKLEWMTQVPGRDEPVRAEVSEEREYRYQLD